MTKGIGKMVEIGPRHHLGWRWLTKTVGRKELRCLALYLTEVLKPAVGIVLAPRHADIMDIMPRWKQTQGSETVWPKSLRDQARCLGCLRSLRSPQGLQQGDASESSLHVGRLSHGKRTLSFLAVAGTPLCAFTLVT